MAQSAVGQPQHCAPVGVEVDDRVGAQHLEEHLDIGRVDQPRRCLERVEPRHSSRVADRAHVFDVDAVNLRDLVHEQVDETWLGESDDQLVDRAAGTAFEDLDADHVAAHRPDAARDLPERPWAIGQPHAHGVVLHHCTLRSLRERCVTPARFCPQSFGSAFRRLRTAWLIRCSFSMSANLTNASPPSPKPMPGEVATSASCTKNDENSSEPSSW